MLQLIEREFWRAQAIRLSDPKGPASVNPPVQVLRCGSFTHPKYGNFDITTATLQELKKNFDDGIRGVDLAVDYFHKSDEEAAGWFEELYLSDDEQELWAKVDWTDTAQAKLAERKVRYFSPDFAFQWQDPESGKTFKNVLFGGGLTNRPFVKDMAAIVAAEGDYEMDEKLKALEAKILKLSEGNDAMVAEHAAMKKKLAEYADAVPPPAPAASDDDDDDDDDDLPTVKKKLALALAENEKLKAGAAKATEAAKLAEKTTAFNILLSEGKACAAQKDAFLKGDMDGFIKLAEKTNLAGNGYSEGSQEGAAANGGDGDVADRVLKLAEEKHKEWGIPLVDAISKARKLVK